MKAFLLHRIRLSWYFVGLLILFGVVSLTIDKVTFSGGALTLFSVNSFLYGFYLAPIFSGQKARIEEMHRVVRNEANAIFAMVLHIKSLPETLRNSIQKEFDDYLDTCVRQRSIAQGEKEYEDLITFCVTYKGAHKDEIKTLLDKLVANQQNRTQLSMLIANKVYSHEWLIMLVLFSITIGFILTIDGGGELFSAIAGFLATGLTMLVVVLVKFSTLTHKKAKAIWDPYKKLKATHYYRID
jgi:hypothetical protein